MPTHQPHLEGGTADDACSHRDHDLGNGEGFGEQARVLVRAGVLQTRGAEKTDSAAARLDMRPMCALGPREASTKLRAISSMAPELARPRLTIRTRATMIVAGWPRP